MAAACCTLGDESERFTDEAVMVVRERVLDRRRRQAADPVNPGLGSWGVEVLKDGCGICGMLSVPCWDEQWCEDKGVDGGGGPRDEWRDSIFNLLSSGLWLGEGRSFVSTTAATIPGSPAIPEEGDPERKEGD